jgi:hypothetical protein
LNLLGPDDFFVTPVETEEEVYPEKVVEESEACLEREAELVDEKEEVEVLEEMVAAKKLFAPLIFRPRRIPKSGAGGGHGHHGGPASESIDKEVVQAVIDLRNNNHNLEEEIMLLQKNIAKSEDNTHLVQAGQNLLAKHRQAVADSEQVLVSKLNIPEKSSTPSTTEVPDETSTAKPAADSDDSPHIHIVHATRCDKIKAAACFVIMATLTVVMCVWDTHLDQEAYVHGPVGLACVTECEGDLETRDFLVVTTILKLETRLIW